MYGIWIGDMLWKYQRVMEISTCYGNINDVILEASDLIYHIIILIRSLGLNCKTFTNKDENIHFQLSSTLTSIISNNINYQQQHQLSATYCVGKKYVPFQQQNRMDVLPTGWMSGWMCFQQTLPTTFGDKQNVLCGNVKSLLQSLLQFECKIFATIFDQEQHQAKLPTFKQFS